MVMRSVVESWKRIVHVGQVQSLLKNNLYKVHRCDVLFFVFEKYDLFLEKSFEKS